MGEEKELPKLFAIDKETGESFEIGTLIEPIEITKDKETQNEEFSANILGTTEAECECFVSLKTIKKKRFIKLLMGKGYQRNEAIKMHEKYKQEGHLRTLLGLELFVRIYEDIKKAMNGQAQGKVVGMCGNDK